MKYVSSISRRRAAKVLAAGASSLFLPAFPLIQQSKTMQSRVIPSSGEEIPIVGLGTWQTFDVGASEQERAPLREVLNILIEHGGSVIDSSPMYGRSEQVVGDITTKLDIKSKIFEATKVWTTGKDEGISQMDNSMKLMQAEPIDLMQIHNLVDWRTHVETLRQWKAEGKIRYTGITHYHSGGYGEVENILKSETLDFVQINYNLLVQDAAKRILPLARDKGVAVLINRPYEGGALFRQVRNMDFPKWAQEFDAHSWGQLFLKFILAHHAVTCVIPGTGKPKHMKDNVMAGFGALPTETHLKKLRELITG